MAFSLALLIGMLSSVIGEATPFLVAFCLVMGIAWHGGLVPGLLAALCSALFLALFVLPPLHSFSGDAKRTRLVIFFLVSGFVCLIIEAQKRAESALRQSEERFRATYEHAGVGIKQISLDGHLLDVNRKLCEILGYAREELLGRPFTALTHPDHRAEEEAHLRRLLDGHVLSYTQEKRYLRKGGAPVWVRVTSSLAGKPGATGAYRISVVEDISERKRAQEVQQFLAQASEILASSLDYQVTLHRVAQLLVPFLADWCAVDIAGDDGAVRPLAVTHTDPAKIAWAEELRRRYPTDPNTPRGIPQVLRTGRAEIYPEISDALLVQAAIDEEHLRILREVGMASAMIVPLTARGRTLGAISLIAAESGRHYGPDDLALTEELARRAATAIENARLYRESREENAERRRAEEALRQSEARMAGIIGSAMDAIITIDREQRILVFNRAAEEMFRLPAGEALGQPIERLIPRRFQEAHRRHIEAFSSTGVTSRSMRSLGTLAACRADGEEFPIEATISQVEIAGQKLYTVILRDITERVRLEEELRQYAEELLEADRRKDEFLAMLGHELRTPMSTIHSSLELLRRRSAGNPDVERLRERIQRQAARMARLIDDLQDISRLSRGKMLLQRETLDLRRLVRDTVEDQRGALEEAGLTLRWEAPETPVLVEGDPIRLAQVVVNLLNNATKFTDAGGQVTVCLSRDERWATVMVQDTGIGIDAGVLPHLFQSFIQAERSLERSRGGLGLGLALVKGLVELHGGEVEVSSMGRGHGTAFTVRIPLAGSAGSRADRELRHDALI